MGRKELAMAAAPAPACKAKRVRKGDPVFAREACLALARRAMKAESMAEAAAIIREVAESVPETVRESKRARGWREHLLALAKGLTGKTLAFKVFADEGNTKLPFVSFSALPFFTCPGMGECEHFCYSLRAWRYPAAFARQLQNTLLMKHDRGRVAAEFRRVKAGLTVRLYVDGDFDSLVTVGFWMGLLAERPDLQAYGYSKSWELLVRYGRHNEWPANYTLNLSTGGRDQGVTVQQMMTLPIVRGQFVAVEIDYRPADPTTGKPVKGNIGFKRYADPEYHRKVREAARKAGYGPVFSCPGKCGSCNKHGHACGGNPKFRGVTIAIGVH